MYGGECLKIHMQARPCACACARTGCAGVWWYQQLRGLWSWYRKCMGHVCLKFRGHGRGMLRPVLGPQPVCVKGWIMPAFRARRGGVQDLAWCSGSCWDRCGCRPGRNLLGSVFGLPF